MLLFLVKHSTSGIVNMTRELSKAAYEELLCIIRYVLDAKNFGLK